MNLTMIGHSTLPLESADSRVVVDPFFASASLAISKRLWR